MFKWSKESSIHTQMQSKELLFDIYIYSFNVSTMFYLSFPSAVLSTCLNCACCSQLQQFDSSYNYTLFLIQLYKNCLLYFKCYTKNRQFTREEHKKDSKRETKN